MEEEKSVFKIIFDFSAKYGIFFGLIVIIYSLLIYIAGIENMLSFWQGILYFLLTVGLFIFCAYRFKKENYEYANFIAVFLAVFFSYMFSGLISLIFNIIFYHFIVPDLPEEILRITIEKTTSLMGNMGVPEDKIEETIEQIKENTDFSIGGLTRGYFTGSFFGLILALIGALIFRKKNHNLQETQ